MDFLELAKQRYSVRNYETKEIEQALLMQVLEAGRIAPTGANRQSQRIYVVTQKDVNRLSPYTNLHGATTALIVCGDHGSAWVRGIDQKDTAVIDATIVCTHMMLEATQLGLGTLWVCSFDPAGIHEEFHMEDSVEPVNILCLGYGTGDIASSERFDQTRKPIEETVYFK